MVAAPVEALKLELLQQLQPDGNTRRLLEYYWGESKLCFSYDLQKWDILSIARILATNFLGLADLLLQ